MVIRSRRPGREQAILITITNEHSCLMEDISSIILAICQVFFSEQVSKMKMKVWFSVEVCPGKPYLHNFSTLRSLPAGLYFASLTLFCLFFFFFSFLSFLGKKAFWFLAAARQRMSTCPSQSLLFRFSFLCFLRWWEALSQPVLRLVPKRSCQGMYEHFT